MSDNNSPKTVFVTLGTHCDLFWMGTHTECLERGTQIQRHALDLMEQYPEYCYYIETTIFADYHLRRFPQDKARMKRLIDKGQLEIGACFVDRVEHSHGGESIIRHAVEGIRWLDETFGAGLRTAAHPDLPGFTPQVPQIYSQAGITCYLHARGVGKVYEWSAPDGSVIIYCNLFGYGEKKPEEYEQILSKPDLPAAFMVRGGYSDLRDVSDTVLSVVAELRRKHPDINIRFASPTCVIPEIQSLPLPRLSGEMPFGWGSISSAFATLMRQSVELEHSLLTLEKINALTAATGRSAPIALMNETAEARQYWKLRWGVEADIFGEPIPDGKVLRELWRYELLCQDHNYGGRHGAQSNWDKEAWREHALREVAARVNHGLNSLLVPGPGERLVLFNPVSWPRSDVVVVPVSKPPTLKVVATDGSTLPSQPSPNGLVIQVNQIPSLSAQTYILEEAATQVPSTSISTHLSGDYIEVDLDPAKGQISHLFDRALGCDLVNADAGHGLGEVVSYKDPGVDVLYGFTGEEESDVGASYRIERAQDGPVFAGITFSGVFLNSLVEKEYILYKKMRRLDVALRVWWWGKRGEHLRMCFPFTSDGYMATWYGVPFYAMRWPEMLNGNDASANSVLEQEELFADMLHQDDRYHFREVIGWLDVNYEQHGITVGTRSTCWWIAGPELQASLLRTQYSCGDTDLWNLNPGFHEWKFRIEPHEGDWRIGKAYRKGEEMLNQLSLARIEELQAHMTVISASTPVDPIHVEPHHVLVTALKPSDVTAGAVILRVLECEGQSADVKLCLPFPVRQADLVDLLERKNRQCVVDGQTVCFPIKAYQFQTVKLIVS